MGVHAVYDGAGEVDLSWRYRVVRLWEMDARDLLAQGRPALLALIGQSRIEEPEVILPEVLARVRKVNPPALRSRLVSSLVALLSDEELIAMVEKMVMDSLDEELMDLPFPRRIRQEGREEGLEQGREEGLRRSIINALTARFSPDTAFQERFSRYLDAQKGR
jgi:predicted transposase YdaD